MRDSAAYSAAGVLKPPSYYGGFWLVRLLRLQQHPPGRNPAEGEGKMTDPAPVPRFVVRRDVGRNTWMIWDRKFHRPAKLERGVAVRLSQEAARLLKDKLEQQRRRE